MSYDRSFRKQKLDAMQTATDLCYSKKVKAMIMAANNIGELNRALKQGRKEMI